MRVRWHVLAGFVAASVSANCGGQTVVFDNSDASVIDASDEDVADAGESCGSLQNRIAVLRSEAQTCCPICNSIQCNHLVDDICCPVSITSQSAPEFSAAVREFKSRCSTFCPATPCRTTPSRQCTPSGGSIASSGVCQ